MCAADPKAAAAAQPIDPAAERGADSGAAEDLALHQGPCTRSGRKRGADSGNEVARPQRRTRQSSQDSQQAAGSCQPAVDGGRNGTASAGNQRATHTHQAAGEEARALSSQSGTPVMAGTGAVIAADMDDSTQAYCQRDWPALQARLQRDGYLMLRGVLPPADVLEARTFLLEELHAAKPHCFAQGVPCHEARLAERASGLGLLARQDLAAAALVAAVLEAPPLFVLMRGLLQEEGVVTSGFKWLRAVGRSEFTGLHTDRVFLGRGTPRLLTAWTPLGDVPPEQGSLLVAAGSHRLPAFAALRGGYGQTQVGADGTRSGWLSDSGAELAALAGAAVDWRVARCCAGDVVVLGLDVLHMSASNESEPPRARLSCDTRWQPAGEPWDPQLKVWRSQADCLPGG